MAHIKNSVLLVALATSLGVINAPSAAQSSAAYVGGGETAGQTNTPTQNERQPQSAGPITPSEADIGITAMMQMLRDEGIDIDARMVRARTDCRDRLASEAGEASAEEIEIAVAECAVVEEGIIYSRAINEMNANRVNNFNDAMTRYNAQLAETESEERAYEREMQGYSSEVAEIERQRQQYERDLAAHRDLLAGREPSPASAPSQQANLDPANMPSPAKPPAETQQTAPSLAINSPRSISGAPPKNDGAASSEPAQVARTADSAPSASARAPSGRAPGRMLSQNFGESSQDEIELAIIEATGPRIALVIGNENYAGSMGALSNPVNDAVLIAATLRSVGFDVEILTDASQREMRDAVRRMGDRLLAAGDNSTGLFYYAGHGVQSQGTNFLIPVGSVVDAESDLELEAVSADAILAQMEELYVSTRIVILDACRNMPLRRRTRNGERGLARMESPNGSFVAYSTSPGNTASDGGGIHSPFAEALAAQMLVPDRPIEVTFREVRRQVVEMTGGDQVPWDSSSLLETFSFADTR